MVVELLTGLGGQTDKEFFQISRSVNQLSPGKVLTEQDGRLSLPLFVYQTLHIIETINVLMIQLEYTIYIIHSLNSALNLAVETESSYCKLVSDRCVQTLIVILAESIVKSLQTKFAHRFTSWSIFKIPSLNLSLNGQHFHFGN